MVMPINGSSWFITADDDEVFFSALEKTILKIIWGYYNFLKPAFSIRIFHAHLAPWTLSLSFSTETLKW